MSIEEESEDINEGENESDEQILMEGELVIRSVEEFEEEKKREKLTLMERLGRVRNPHLRQKMVLEPCIPWEYGSNKHDSQKGMGGFGRIRNTTVKIQSSKEWAKDDRRAMPKWNQSGFAGQAGQTPFGARREPVTKVVEHPQEGELKKECQELMIDQRKSDQTLKLWARPNPEAKNQKLFGCKRQIVGMSMGGREWTGKELAQSRAAMPRFWRVDETSAAKDGREAIRGMATGFVHQRQTIMQISGLGRSEIDQLESNKYQSWLGGQLLLQTQSKTGGFQKPRNVVNTSYYENILN